MPIRIVAERELIVGSALVVEGPAPAGTYLAVFEDDEDTGYFYALDTSVADQPIQDAVHIYNAANVVDSAEPSIVKVGWSQDSTKVVLLINDQPHAIFDFSAKRGYCRTGFPPPRAGGLWSGHEWEESAINLFG